MTFYETILRYANRQLIDNQKPQQWSDINLIPIPKSGDLGNTTNYRGIALSSVVAKLVNRMLLAGYNQSLTHSYDQIRMDSTLVTPQQYIFLFYTE